METLPDFQCVIRRSVTDDKKACAASVQAALAEGARMTTLHSSCKIPSLPLAIFTRQGEETAEGITRDALLACLLEKLPHRLAQLGMGVALANTVTAVKIWQHVRAEDTRLPKEIVEGVFFADAGLEGGGFYEPRKIKRIEMDLLDPEVCTLMWTEKLAQLVCTRDHFQACADELLEAYYDQVGIAGTLLRGCKAITVVHRNAAKQLRKEAEEAEAAEGTQEPETKRLCEEETKEAEEPEKPEKTKKVARE